MNGVDDFSDNGTSKGVKWRTGICIEVGTEISRSVYQLHEICS